MVERDPDTLRAIIMGRDLSIAALLDAQDRLEAEVEEARAERDRARGLAQRMAEAAWHASIIAPPFARPGYIEFQDVTVGRGPSAD